MTIEHHTIDDDQRRRIVQALEREDVSDLSPIEHLSSPHELHQFMMHYNWDDGDDAVMTVLDHPRCDFGTALLIYWLSGPIVCESTRDEVIKHMPWSSRLYDRIDKLESQLLEGEYSASEFSVDPRNLMYDGSDWTERSPDNAFKRDPPTQLCDPSPGRVMLQDDLIYQLTPEETAERKRQELAHDLEALEEAAKRDPAMRPNLEAYKRKYGLCDSPE